MNIEDNFFSNVDFSDEEQVIIEQNETEINIPSQNEINQFLDTLPKSQIDSQNQVEELIDESDVSNIQIIASELENKNQDTVNKTIIESDCHIIGDIKSKSNVLICGVVKNGSVKAGGTITLSPTGFVEQGIFAKGDVLINKRNHDENKYINGTIQGQNITIDGGFIKGDVKAVETLKLSKDSVIVGNVICKKAIIDGAIQGNITANENIDLNSSAIIKGSVTSGAININPDAILDGTFTLTNNKTVDYDKIFKY